MSLNKGGLRVNHGSLAKGKIWRDPESGSGEAIVIPDGVRVTSADTDHWRITVDGSIRVIQYATLGYLYHDSFSGPAATFVGRTPDGVGAAYVPSAILSGTLANISVTGANRAVYGGVTAAAALSAFAGGRCGTTYTLELKYVHPSLTGIGNICYGFAADKTLDVELVRVRVLYNSGATAAVRLFVFNTAGVELYRSSTFNVAITAGVISTATATVTPSGIVLNVDGVDLDTTAILPNVTPDAAAIGLECQAGYLEASSLAFIA